MASKKEFEMAIKIAGEIEKSFYESSKLTQKELKNIARQAVLASEAMPKSSDLNFTESLRKGLKDAEPAFSSLEKTAKSTFKAVSTAAVAAGTATAVALGAAVAKGSEFESAFAGVKKTVNATDTQLQEMRDDIRQMATEMPKTAAGLSEIAESAGQLGIQTDNITLFTKTMADMEVATNLTSDEAATDFAKFANITNMSQKYFDRLGSSVVALGNNMATTESDTVAMGMRIAAAGTQVKLSQADIMAYAASLSSVGIEAEAGGSAFSKLLVNMQLAAETGKGLSGYAKAAGMSGQEFQTAFKNSPTTAINAFLAGLNDTERNGKSAIAVLNDMGIKETRLRDTLLRAANASDLFADALQISNSAWEENTALANEAEQRYSTFESQVDILQNKLTDVGIGTYDAMKPMLTEGIGLANEFMDGMIGQEDAIAGVMESATKKMPTFVREAKEAGEAIGEFAEPFLKVGGWLVENPGLITGTIAGVGTALGTYKIASGVMSLAGALGALGPAGWTIMGIGGTAAVITGIGTAVKKSAAEAKKANLAAHFGSVSLSLSELQKTASFVVKSKELDKITQSVKAMSELDGISDTIDSAVESVNKMNWKVQIGIELSDQEKQDYQQQYQALVDSTQEYLSQEQYAVSLSVGTLVQDDLESSNIVTQINQFYADKQQDLADLGKQLNETITDAFQDGLLDVDEVAEISKLQEQIAHIKSALAESDFEAGLDLIGTKYQGQMLDADTFQNLQAEISDQLDTAMESYDEAYKTSMSKLRLMQSEGGMTDAEFQAAADSVNEGYLQQKQDLQIQAVQFQMDTIRQAYGDDLDQMIEEIKKDTDERLGDALQVYASGGNTMNFGLIGVDIVKDMKGSVDKSTRDALADLYDQMEPQLEQMQSLAEEYRKAGKAIPEALQQSIVEASAIGGLGGDSYALWDVIADSAKSEEYTKMIQQVEEAGGYVPQQVAAAIMDKQNEIDNAVKKSYLSTQETIDNIYGKNSFQIPINITPNVSNAPYSSSALKGVVKTGHADGGIFDQPHIAWFAESGPEAAIPLDGSQNAISLWQKTGELLGLDGLDGTDENSMSVNIDRAIEGNEPQVNIEYHPVLNFEGSVNREEVAGVMETEQDKFNRMMSQWAKENLRFSFGR